MGQQGGFQINCSSANTAKQAAELAQEFIQKQHFSQDCWSEYIHVWGSTFGVYFESFIEFSDYNGVFEKMCRHIESKLPGAIMEGEARYWQTVTDFILENIVKRGEDGLQFIEHTKDWDMVADMLEEGVSIEMLVEMTGFSEEEIREFAEYEEDEEEE